MAILRNKLRPFSADRYVGLAGFIVLAACLGYGQTTNSCLDCHSALPDPLGVSQDKFSQDIHAQKGLTCASCHGGDPTSDDPDKAMSRKAGWKSKIDRKQIRSYAKLPFGSGIYAAVQPQLAYRPVGPVPHQYARQTLRGWRHEGCSVRSASISPSIGARPSPRWRGPCRKVK